MSPELNAASRGPDGEPVVDPRRVVWTVPGSSPRTLRDEPPPIDGRPLVVCLHGWSSSARDVSTVVDRLGEAVFAAPDGPEPSATPHPGRQWFALPFGPDGALLGTGDPHDGEDDERDRASRELIERGADGAARAVLAWLDGLAAAATPSSVSLMGFSQGGILAMQLLRHAPERFACAALVSGFVVPAPHPGDAVLARRRPPVFWGRGELDDVIPPLAIEASDAWLRGHTTLELRSEPTLGHEFSNEMLEAMRAFYATRI